MGYQSVFNIFSLMLGTHSAAWLFADSADTVTVIPESYHVWVAQADHDVIHISRLSSPHKNKQKHKNNKKNTRYSNYYLGSNLTNFRNYMNVFFFLGGSTCSKIVLGSRGYEIHLRYTGGR